MFCPGPGYNDPGQIFEEGESAMKILLAEDEETLATVLIKGLRKKGFAVDRAETGEDVLYQYSVNSYDLIVLDLNLPVIDGMEVLARIRAKDPVVRILILSARSGVADRIVGLNQGANDYLVKPFDFDELVARIHNLLRQSFVQRPSRLSAGPLCMDLLTKTVSVSSMPLALTNKEYGILEYLLLHRGRVIGQSELIEHIWDSESDPFSNSLKFHLHSLRKKLGEADPISNLRGQGYFIPEEELHG